MAGNNKFLQYVISLSSSKGGVGKTTLTNVLAQALAAQGYRVTIIDADPNFPQKNWAKLSERNEVMPDNIEVVQILDDDSVIKTIREWKEKSDVTLIDLEGRGSMVASDAMSRSDLVIIPAQPSMLDSREASKGLRLIREAEERFERSIPHVVTFSKTSVMLKPENYWELREQFEGQNVPILNVELREREQYRDIFLYGGSLKSLHDFAIAQVTKYQPLADTAAVLIKERAEKPPEKQSKAQKDRLKQLRHDRKRLLDILAKFNRRIEGYKKAQANATELVAAVINFVQGNTAAATYEKGQRPKGSDFMDLDFIISEMETAA